MSFISRTNRGIQGKNTNAEYSGSVEVPQVRSTTVTTEEMLVNTIEPKTGNVVSIAGVLQSGATAGGSVSLVTGDGDIRIDTDANIDNLGLVYELQLAGDGTTTLSLDPTLPDRVPIGTDMLFYITSVSGTGTLTINRDNILVINAIATQNNTMAAIGEDLPSVSISHANASAGDFFKLTVGSRAYFTGWAVNAGTYTT